MWGECLAYVGEVQEGIYVGKGVETEMRNWLHTGRLIKK